MLATQTVGHGPDIFPTIWWGKIDQSYQHIHKVYIIFIYAYVCCIVYVCMFASLHIWCICLVLLFQLVATKKDEVFKVEFYSMAWPKPFPLWESSTLVFPFSINILHEGLSRRMNLGIDGWNPKLIDEMLKYISQGFPRSEVMQSFRALQSQCMARLNLVKVRRLPGSRGQGSTFCMRSAYMFFSGIHIIQWWTHKTSLDNIQLGCTATNLGVWSTKWMVAERKEVHGKQSIDDHGW